MLLRLLPQILLILALLLAQLGGLTHGVSHSTADKDPRSEQSQRANLHCDLCDEYAQIGSAIRTTPIAFQPIIPDVSHPSAQSHPAPTTLRVVFAARAPPYTAYS